MLKLSVLTGIIAAIASVSAKLYITLPDSESTWYSGSIGIIQWNTSATEFGLLCDIQLINAQTKEIALNITDKPVPCSIDRYNTSILPNFEDKKFLVRIGENSNSSTFSYTQDFKILPSL